VCGWAEYAALKAVDIHAPNVQLLTIHAFGEQELILF
jgi:hypothetical protein